MAMKEPLTLARLSAKTGVPPRTIRSWVADQLVPGPLSRGRGATYPAESLERVRQVRLMREAGRSAEEIRRNLAFGAEEDRQPHGLREPSAERFSQSEPEYLAVHYIANSLSRAPSPEFPSGFTALAQQLGAGTDYDPDAAARSSDWVSYEVSPDVELNVRGPLSERQRRSADRSLLRRDP